jgi:hypothetical protein
MSQPSRSEEVVENFKKHKLALSALRRIQDLLRGFEREREFDRRLARVGLVIILVLVAVSMVWLSSTGSTVLR